MKKEPTYEVWDERQKYEQKCKNFNEAAINARLRANNSPGVYTIMINEGDGYMPFMVFTSKMEIDITWP